MEKSASVVGFAFFVGCPGGGGGGCKVQVVGHCFTITETTQTFTKMLTLPLNIIFRPNVSIGKGLGCSSSDETMTFNPSLQPAV